MLIRDKYFLGQMMAQGLYEEAFADERYQEQPVMLLSLLQKIQGTSLDYLTELFAKAGNLDQINYPAHPLDRAVIYEVSFFASASYALWYATKTIQAIKDGKELKPMFTGKKQARIPKKQAKICVAELAAYFGKQPIYADFFATSEKREHEAKQLYQLAAALAEAADRNFLDAEH